MDYAAIAFLSAGIGAIIWSMVENWAQMPVEDEHENLFL